MRFKHSYMHNHAFYTCCISNLHHQIQLNLQLQRNLNFNSIRCQLSNSIQSQLSIQSQCQFNSVSISKFNSISISNSIQFQLSIQCLCLCLCLISIFNLSFNINLQFHSMSLSIHSQFALGPTIMVMSIFQVNVNLPSVGILLNQTSNLHLAMGQAASSIQKNSLYPAYVFLSVKRQVRSKEQFAPTYMLWYWSSSRFDPKNSLYHSFVYVSRPNGEFDSKNSLSLPICLTFSIKWQVRSKEQLVSAYMSMFPVKWQVRS
jgi:hypothetical protein